MNKQELIEKINEIATETPFPDSKIVDLSEAIELIEQLDEPIKEAEKEKKYTVKFKATKQYLSNDELGIHFDPSFRSNFTKSDLEKLGLGWVFDCEGMEVEKVGK